MHVVRTTQNAETGQPETDRLGVVPIGRMRVSEDLAAKLSSDEKIELDVRVGELQALATLRQKAAAHTLAWSANDAVRYLAGVTDEAETEALRTVFAEAAATLRRAAKPKTSEAEAGEGKRGGKGKNKGKGAKPADA